MSDPSSVERSAASPDGPSWWYPDGPTRPDDANTVEAGESTEASDSSEAGQPEPGMDAAAVAEQLRARLSELGIGHTIEVVNGRHADGVLVRSPYADPVTVVDDAGRYALVARGADGNPKVVDTELSVRAPVELLSLYLAFHALWSMKRLVDRHGVEAVARRQPSLITHQQLVIAFIAGSLTSGDEGIRSYAAGLMGTATNMLKA